MTAPMIDVIDSNLSYKSLEVGREFNNLDQIDSRLYGMIQALGRFTWETFRKRIVITDVVRITGSSTSPHFITEKNPRARAVDIRAHHGYWTDNELRIIKNWLRDNFPRSDQAQLEANPKTNWYGPSRQHGTGAHEHLHICVERRKQFWEAIDWQMADVDPIELEDPNG